MTGLPLPVIGMGAVSCLGTEWPSIWAALLEGRRAVGPFKARYPALQVDVSVAAVPNANRELEGTLGCAARLARQALYEACGGDLNGIKIYGGSNHGEADLVVHAVAAIQGQQHAQAADMLWPALLQDPMPDHLCLGTKPRSWVHSACASGMHALLFAATDLADLHEDGPAAVIAADALSDVGVIGFVRSLATSSTACRPFHKNRDGLLVGEGAACLVLDSRLSGRPRDIGLLGYGQSCDAGHPTHPDEEGIQLERCVRASIERAGLIPSDIGAAILHGTGTPANDAVEALVIGRIWSDRPLMVTSLKSSLGHTMGAAGLFNCLAAIESLRSGILPPIYTDGSDTLEGVDVVTGSARPIDRAKPILVTCAGFGGNNVAAIFGPI